MMKKCLRIVLVLCFVCLIGFAQKEDYKASTAEEQAERLREIYTEIYPAYEVTGQLSYFTVNGKACTHAYNNANGCTNCGLASILTDLNKKDTTKFGEACSLYNSSPKNAWTCCAFQRFVQLYVFGTREWIESEYTTLFSMKKASYSYFSQLRPGDEVNYKNSAGTTKHYAIFLGCDEKTVTILDCNYLHAKYGVAVVTVRTVTYDSLSSYYFTTYRANNSKLTADNFDMESISMDPTYITLPVGESFDFKLGGALETNEDSSSLNWASNDASIATVSNGVVAGKKAGKVTITVTTEGGMKDTVTVNVVNVSYNAAEKWTVSSTEIGARVSNGSSAERATRYANGYYVVKKGAELTILAKKTDDSGNTWGFGAGYSEYLGQNIWGWFNLLDENLGSEEFNYSYYPGKPTVTVKKTSEDVVTISWTSASSATSYDVYKNDKLIKSGVTTTSVTNEMSFGESANFKVVAVNKNFPYSNLFTCTTTSTVVSFTMPECSHPTANRVIRNAQNATCSSTGYSGDTYCTLCEKKISSGNIIEKISHSYSSTWSKDVTGHWHICVVCNTKQDIEKHTPGPAATENSAQSCTVCGYIITQALGHTHDYSNEWKCNEHQHWHECKCGAMEDSGDHVYDNSCDATCNLCGYERSISHAFGMTWVLDEKNHWKVCTICGKAGDKEAHIGGASATETTSQKCTICDYVITPMLGHIHKFAEGYEYDEMMHWHLCGCGQKNDMEVHTWDKGVINLQPTENAEGEMAYTCTVCEMTVVENIGKLENSEDTSSELVSESTEQESYESSSEVETDDKEIDKGDVETEDKGTDKEGDETKEDTGHEKDDDLVQVLSIVIACLLVTAIVVLVCTVRFKKK